MAKPAKTGIVKKKQWVTILSPAIFNNAPVGETYIEEADAAVGRKMKVSLTAITGDPQKQNLLVNLEITGKRDNALTTELKGYGLAPASVRKMMRRKRDKVTDSFIAVTKDRKTIRLKPIIVTKFRASGSVLSGLHKKAKQVISAKVSQTKFADLIHELITRKFQKEILGKLKKVYPLQICEVRQLTVETGKDAKEEPKAAEPKKAVQEA